MIFHPAVRSSVANNASRYATKSASVRVSPTMPCRDVYLVAASKRRSSAGSDVECGDHGLCAVADIFELAPFNLPRQHRQRWCRALQRLHADHFVNGNRVHTFSGRSRRLGVCRANLCALRFELRVWFGGKPVADEMGLDR